MKKARYDGPSGTGVDLNVTLADGQVRPVHVDQGHQLPSDIGGVPVPATFVNALLEQDVWSEVKPKSKAKSKAADSKPKPAAAAKAETEKNDDKAASPAEKEG